MSTTISATLKDYYTRERDILATEPSIRAELQSLGVAHLQAEYDGVGDSGQIDDITFLDGAEPGRPVPVEAQLREQGLYPVFPDTFKKADEGLKECSCRSAGSSVPSSSREPLIRFVGRKSAVPRSPAS